MPRRELELPSRVTETFPPDEDSGAPSWAAAPHGDITNGPLNRTLWHLAGPAILAKALHALLNLVDVFWVGRLGAAPTAAVTTSFFVSWVLLALTDVTAIGILAHVARHMGAGDRQRAGHVAAQGLGLGVGLGALLAAGAWFAAPALFALLGAAPEVVRPGVVYLRVLFLAAPLTFTYINCESVMRAAGDTRSPMLVTGGMVLLNAGLAPFLIFGIGPFPRLEVLGAALATLVAQVAAVLAFGVWALARHPSFPLDRRSFRRLDRALAQSLLRIGSPAMAIGLLFSFIYLFLSGVAARLGTLQLAVLGLANRTESLTYLVSNGFAAATATMVGQNLGAGRPERAERAAWWSALWMGLYGLVLGAFLVIWPRRALGLFTSETAVFDMGADYVRVLGFCQAFMAVEIVFENAFAGAGDTLPPMLISVPMNILRVPLVLWAVRGQGAGLLGIAWILSTTGMLRGIIAAVWFHRGDWKRRGL